MIHHGGMTVTKATCLVHGTWVFATDASRERWALEHSDCKWPVSTRRFPPKSRQFHN